MRISRAALVFALGVVISFAAKGGIITTVAGNGYAGFSGDGGPATSASLDFPAGVAVDGSGNIFIADTFNYRIRKVYPNGTITTVAGNGIQGISADGGPATSASLIYPQGVAVDALGNLFIADLWRIRKVSTSGIITTVAGNGYAGFSGDGGPATSAQFLKAVGVAVDSSGNLFIADYDNNRIRKVSANSGIITTVAGIGVGVGGFSGDGGPATSAWLASPTGVAVDASGNLFIADYGNNRIRKVSTTGIITTVAGPVLVYVGSYGVYLELVPQGVAVDASGNLFIADIAGGVIEKLSTGGSMTTVAGNLNALGYSGDNGPATSASLRAPSGVAVDASGDLFIADTQNNRIRKVSASLPPPSITSGGIVPVYSTVATIQPGEWVSIYGTDLGSSTVTWTGNFPMSLGGAGVTVNGKSAYLWFVSPTQINMQAPSDTTTGPVPVVVTTASGTFTSTVTLAQFAPSFSLLDSKHVTGIILRSNGSGAYGGGTYDILGPTGNSLGYPTVAAKAGDTVELFAVGLGPTSPAVLAGQAFSGSAPTTNSVSLLINSVNVVPTFTGLSSAGLYQINLIVPVGLGTGDVSLVATVGGAKTPPNVLISLQ
jgi:uncharacterized protein (TIGR03437 family)